jgi:hypothetical protein
MVLHLADHDIVARPEKTFAPCIRHRIERRSSSGRENDLLPGFRTDVLGDTSPGSLVHLGSLLRKKMNPPVDIGIRLPVQAIDRFDHALGFLRRSAAVQINQRLVVHAHPENREVPPDFFHIEHNAIFYPNAGQRHRSISLSRPRSGSARPRPPRNLRSADGVPVPLSDRADAYRGSLHPPSAPPSPRDCNARRRRKFPVVDAHRCAKCGSTEYYGTAAGHRYAGHPVPHKPIRRIHRGRSPKRRP